VSFIGGPFDLERRGASGSLQVEERPYEASHHRWPDCCDARNRCRFRVAVEDDYDDTQSHPLRVAAYLAYPIGFTAEWLVLRPFHYLISRPSLESVFDTPSTRRSGRTTS